MKAKKTMIVLAVGLVGIILAAVVGRHLGGLGGLSTGSRDEQAHDEHREHDGQRVEKVIRLSDAEMEEFNIEVGTAGPGKLQISLSFPGEIVANADRLAHIVARVPGVVSKVRKNLGDHVRGGEVLAVLESRELADTKAAFLAASERNELAQANFTREESLWKKKISSEQEYLEAKRARAEARIELRSAEQKLHALGFSDEYLAQLPGHPDIAFTRYELLAPFNGTVIEKHITLGEVLQDDTEAFIIADLSSVWVNLSVYEKDLSLVREGQPAVISVGKGIPDARGEISYLGPVVDEQTRTALARVVLPNTDGRWRPGLFVTGKILVDDLTVPLLVPKSALQTLEDKISVFVATEEGFEPQPVMIGRTNETHVEVTSGLTPGQRYVKQGGFTLKAQLSKGAFGEGHNH
jgi:cobalt-zinc-cadmium efflux system membrane fusion protein